MHAADLHLGGPAAAPDKALAPLAAEARERGLKRLTEISRERGVNLVLLAGDVFHTPRPPLPALLALQEACAAWLEMGARVFIAPGNHDPFEPGSVWADWRPPKGVHVFTPEPEGVELNPWGLWLAGAGHHGPHVERDLSALLPPPPGGRTGLALLHADLPSSRDTDAHQPYAPARLNNLKDGPFAFWALGHWHQPRVLSQRPLVLMAGTHQGAHLDEDGPRGGWLVEHDSGSWQSEFLPAAPLVFQNLLLDRLGEVGDPAALAGLARSALGPRTDAAVCLRLTLSGPSPLWRELAGEALADGARALKQSLGLAGLVLRASGLVPPVDLDGLQKRPDVLGRLLALASRAAQDDAYLAELEQRLLGDLHPWLRGMDPAGRRRRLRELLDDVRGLAVRDLWRPGDEGSGGDHAP